MKASGYARMALGVHAELQRMTQLRQLSIGRTDLQQRERDLGRPTLHEHLITMMEQSDH